MPTPSEVLGKEIAARLVAEGLLSGEQAEQLLPGLVKGSVKQEDWRLAVEISDQDEEGEDG